MKRIQIGKLDRAIREDLYNMHAMYTDPDANERAFYQKYVDIVEIDLNSIPDSQLYQHMNEEECKEYVDILKNEETRFAVVADGKLLDGMHRITSLKSIGEKKMLAVDLSGLIDTHPHMAGHICEVEYKSNKLKRTNKLR